MSNEAPHSNESSRSILEVRQITHSFRGRRVLNGVTFDVLPGQIVGITGENGSGKSTLLKIIAGLLSPDSGAIIVRGRIGYCPQEILVFDRLTVRENLTLFATAYRRDDGGTFSGDEESQRFHFRQYEHTLANELSAGTKQKLNLSLAIIHSPDLLILDEPYSGFDWETYLRFWEYAHDERRCGKSILIVSHLVYDRSSFDVLHKLENGILQCI